MILAVAATELEMSPFEQSLSKDRGLASDPELEHCCALLISGVGPVETTLHLTRYLDKHERQITKVINFGVAGAYLAEASRAEDNVALLDICLAEQESMGDCGICFADHIEAFAEQLGGRTVFPLDQPLLYQAREILRRHQIACHCGNFVTVAAASATRERGMMLAARYQAICENMEGAAVARVCAEFSLPLLELRAVSNLVEDRDLSRWQLAEACVRAAGAAALLVRTMEKS